MMVTSNGLGNFYQQARDNAMLLANGKNVLAINVYNPTIDGGSRWDTIREAILANLIRQRQTVQVAIGEQLKEAIGHNNALDWSAGVPPGTTMTEFLGHSQGTINGHLAIEVLSTAQRSQLRVFSVGTASWHLPKGLGRFVNIVDPNDLVVNLTGGRAISESEYALGRGDTHRVVLTAIPRGNHISHSLYLYAQQPAFQDALRFVPREMPLDITRPFAKP